MEILQNDSKPVSVCLGFIRQHKLPGYICAAAVADKSGVFALLSQRIARCPHTSFGSNRKGFAGFGTVKLLIVGDDEYSWVVI